LESEVGRIIGLFVFFGWIPILALGKAISMIVYATRCNINENNEEDDSE
jgi:hypothetical protein